MSNRALLTLAGAMLAVGTVAGSAAAATLNPYIGVNFHGRTSADFPLAAGDVAGVVGHANWNDFGRAGIDASESGPLMDSTGADTTVTLSTNSDTTKAWYAEAVDATVDPLNPQDAEMVKAHYTIGYNNGNGTTSARTFTFHNVPTLDDGESYALILYGVGRSGSADMSATAGGTTYYYTVQDPTGWNDAGAWIRGTATDSANRAVANYIQFDNLLPANDGTISVALESTAITDNAVLSGMQLAIVPEPASLALLGLGGTLMLVRRRQA